MPIIYTVTIKPVEEENLYHITWQQGKNKSQRSFINRLTIPHEELLTGWEKASNQSEIGEALSRLLDGDDNTRYLSQQLEKAAKAGKKIQLNLRACRETADWPFELIAINGTFLVFYHLHLVRRVSDRGIDSKPEPAHDRTRLLFMASDFLGKDSGLMYAKEEEAIKKICRTFPIEMAVIDSGSLQGLQDRLEKKYYDILHVTGHAGIGAGDIPIFYMRDIAGKRGSVEPEKFWEGALIENPPRILFLSGCHTGQMKALDKKKDIESFATLMVEKYKLPLVLGWGRKVNDLLAVYCAEAIYRSIGQGLSMLEAVQQARQKMHLEWERISKISETPITPAWPMLRVYCNGLPITPLLLIDSKSMQKNNLFLGTGVPQEITGIPGAPMIPLQGAAADRRSEGPSNETNDYLPYSRVKVLKEGFIWRRTQLQIAMDALGGGNYDYFGVLLLGTGGLGKSCLAGKICERFPDHTPIVIEGKLDDSSVKTALQRVFEDTRDETGLKKLAGNRSVTDTLADLFSSSFKERNYLLVLDGFEQNLGKTETGRPGDLGAEASELLNTMLYYLPFSGKTSKLIITSRYSFTLTGRGSRNFAELLKKVWLTGFSELEAERKIQELNPIVYRNSPIKELLVKAGRGNPLLIEEIVRLAGQVPAENIARLEEEIEKARESFTREIGLDLLYRQSSESMKKFLEGFLIYDKPVPGVQIPIIAQKAGLDDWQGLLQEGTDLGLVEYDQAEGAYVLTPLLRKRHINKKLLEVQKPFLEKVSGRRRQS